MASDIAIRIEGVGKRYRLGHTIDLRRTLRETLVIMARDYGRRAFRALRALAGRAAEAPSPSRPAPGSLAADRPNAFWALRDVNLEVQRGDVVGIIGRNGAGKSTLLKILSRITTPTTGHIEMRGRLSSLLEVGTGFNPELTGRENIYLNGAILGMRKSEIDRKFDDIVAFAETEKFLDTPIKRYSSGMSVRLAFAVAAHLQPEILIVDEVLSVGDSEFQKKCIGKMEDVSSQGRTVLFVSHNMQVIKRLCSHAVLLREGQVQQTGLIDEVIDSYLSSGPQVDTAQDIPPQMHRRSPPDLEIYRVEIADQEGELTREVRMQEPFTLTLYYRVRDAAKSYRIGLVLRSRDGARLASAASHAGGLPFLRGNPGEEWRLPIRIVNPLQCGSYTIDFIVKDQGDDIIDSIEGIPFHVAGVSAVPGYPLQFGGYVCLESRWAPPERIC